MEYLDNKLVEKAFDKDKKLGGFVKVLFKFGICGVIEYDIKKIVSFLKRNKVSFGYNEKTIWIDTLEKTIKNMYEKNNLSGIIKTC